MHIMLPENLYYTLSDAAEELKCDIGRLFHLAANGYLSLCTKVYSPPSMIGVANDDWSCELLINEEKLRKVLEHKFSLSKAQGGTFLIKDDVVTRYSRLQIGIDCFVDDNGVDISDFSPFIYGVYGLLQINTRDVFINENALSRGLSVSVASFDLPVDNSNGCIDGYFGFFSSEFNNGWHSDTVDIDDYSLRNAGLSNSLALIEKKIEVDVNNIYVTACEINRLKGITRKKPEATSIDTGTKFYKLPEFCKTLVCLATGMSSDDVDNMSAEKLKLNIQKKAAKQGVEFPELYHSTLAKYIGKNKK